MLPGAAISNNFEPLFLLIQCKPVLPGSMNGKPTGRHACHERNEERRKGTNLQVMI